MLHVLPTRFVDAATLEVDAAGRFPCDVWSRDHVGERWLVAGLDGQGDSQWFAVTGDGLHVAVPLIPYLVPPAPESVLGFGLELAARRLTTLPEALRRHGLREVTQVQISLVTPAEDLRPEQPLFRILAGLAFRVH